MVSRLLIVFLIRSCWYVPLLGLVLGWQLAVPSYAQDAPVQVAATKSLSGSEKVVFDRDIRPILSDKCYFCHGPDANKRAADLRLDDEESAKATAIVAGKPDESELIKRILSTDPDVRMPPPESKLTLGDVEKEKLQRWIEQGAEYSKHWAFISLGDSIDVPTVKNEAWFGGAI